MTELAPHEATADRPFQLGEPVEHRGVVVCPLFPVRDPRARYLTLEEALARGLCIRETSEAGSVPELHVVNPLAENVLLYGGEELVGAKQNRILDARVLVGGKSELRSPSPASRRGGRLPVSATTSGSRARLRSVPGSRSGASCSSSRPSRAGRSGERSDGSLGRVGVAKRQRRGGGPSHESP